MDFEWDDVRFFISLSRHQRLQRAAQELRVEHTTVSRRILQLESRLGVLLFQRSAQGYLLNAKGREFLSEARRMEKSAHAFGKLASGQRTKSEKPVKIAIIESLATEWLAPRLGAFHDAHPDIQLEILSDGNLSDLSKGEADIAVRAPKPRQGGLMYARLSQVSFGLYGTPGAVELARKGLAAGKPISLLAFSENYHHLQSARWFQSHLRSSKPIMVATSTLALLQTARSGAGIAVLPRFAAERGGDLVPLNRKDVSSLPIWLVRTIATRKERRVTAVADFLKSIARGPGGLY